MLDINKHSENETYNLVGRAPTWEKISIFAFGIVFIVVLLLIAVAIPDPTHYQVRVFNTVLALAAAGVAALIPGFINIRFKNVIRAGGAAAVFALVYLLNPATNIARDERKDTDPFKISLIQMEGGKPTHYGYEFPLRDVRDMNEDLSIFGLLEKLPSSRYSKSDFTIFRMSDEALISDKSAITEKNDCLLVVSNDLIEEYDSNHTAFAYIRSQLPPQYKCN
jgi:hypothetical protein